MIPFGISKQNKFFNWMKKPGSTPAPEAPLTVPDDYLWLDPSDSTKRTVSGGKFTDLVDKTGNGYNFTQPLSANQPLNDATINSLDVLHFDGSDRYMTNLLGSINLLGAHTIFFVLQSLNATSNKNYFSKYPYASEDCDYGVTGGNQRFVFTIRNDGGYLSATQQGTNPIIWAATHDGAGAIAFWKSGVSAGSGSAFDATAANLAATCLGKYEATSSGDFFDGYIGDIIMYSRVITDSEKNTVGSYLGTKWGITWTSI